MARLVVRSDGFGDRVIELKLGVNRLGRHPDNDFQIEHPTISSTHCELKVDEGELHIRDCDSTNGTFFQGELIKEVRLTAGQSFNVGDVELFIETTEITVAIPKIEVPAHKAPPVVLSDGSLLCSRHPRAHVTHQCTKCREVMCEACIHQLRRRGGKVHKLCPICSSPVQQIGGEKKKKRGFLDILHKTMKMPFLQGSKRAE